MFHADQRRNWVLELGLVVSPASQPHYTAESAKSMVMIQNPGSLLHMGTYSTSKKFASSESKGGC